MKDARSHQHAPPYRWQLGLLLQSLPRRLIPGGFRDLPAGGPDDAFP